MKNVAQFFNKAWQDFLGFAKDLKGGELGRFADYETHFNNLYTGNTTQKTNEGKCYSLKTKYPLTLMNTTNQNRFGYKLIQCRPIVVESKTNKANQGRSLVLQHLYGIN